MKRKKALKRALPVLMVATLMGATMSWYLANRKRVRTNQPDVDFQAVTV